MSTGLHESVSIRNEASQNASNMSNPRPRINTSECQELEGTHVDISSLFQIHLVFLVQNPPGAQKSESNTHGTQHLDVGGSGDHCSSAQQPNVPGR